MIRHIVFFSAKEPQYIPIIKETLLSYRDIPSILKLEVQENIKQDSLSSEIDIILYAEFESLASLQEYKNHPIYKNGIKIIRPLRELRYVVDSEFRKESTHS